MDRTESKKRKELVYDLPTRLFHWLFAVLFLSAFGIAKTIDDESRVFTFHMLLGLTLGGLVLWRIVWGVMGSQYARFSQFALRPRELVSYLTGIVSNKKENWTGHNPASSWASLFMMGSGLGLVLSGVLMILGTGKEFLEEFHEWFATSFAVLVILHICGLILHSMRYRDGIALSMVTGKKEDVTKPISKVHFGTAAFLLALLLGWAIYLFQNFDSQSQKLRLPGLTLQLGEPITD
ncbi:cytochrome b [bacterium]|nr:cytochrome b [bacterium]NBX82735.1 cytochrome b [bacterium]